MLLMDAFDVAVSDKGSFVRCRSGDILVAIGDSGWWMFGYGGEG